MIEKLARVLANEAEADWEAMPLLHKLVFRSSARACLEALREPSEEMLAVAVPEPTHLYAEYGRDDPEFESRMKAVTQVDRLAVREAWQSMIDVALERKAA